MTFFSRRSTGVAFSCAICLFSLSAMDQLVAQQEGSESSAAPQVKTAVSEAQPVPSAASKPGESQSTQAKGKPERKPSRGRVKKSDRASKSAEKSPALTKRPTKPKTPPKPEELKIRPGSDGLISFSFKGQQWPDVLEWLADISGMSLEWQEAPPGYLDLTTRGRYTAQEVRDLINSVLLSKGYTLLRNEEILLVSNLEKLDPSLVPRVTPSELDERGTYELVKVFFDLDWLVAETLAEELKPMLSPHAKITALKTTNRLDVLDTVGSLRRMRDLLKEEQSVRGLESLFREFKLVYSRASDVLETLNLLLGIKKAEPAVPMNPAQQRAAQQAAAAAAQAAAQRKKGATPAKPPEPKIYLAINKRQNSILATAPPDKMAIIEQAINAIDVPQGSSGPLMRNLPRLQIYRLSGVDPDTLVKVLQDLGDLDPTTRLEVDSNSRAIIVNGPLADHVLIQSLVDRIDGSGRRFEVIQLRHLEAEYVAGSIEFLMRGAEKKEQTSPYFFYRGRSPQEDTSDKFQVEADPEHNRLLLRANDVELAEIHELLVKLGEIPVEGRDTSTVRVIPVGPGDETDQLLERIRRLWPSVGPNPLEIEPAETAPAQEEDDTAPETTLPGSTVPKKPAAYRAERSQVQDRPDPSSTPVGAKAVAKLAPYLRPSDASGQVPQSLSLVGFGEEGQALQSSPSTSRKEEELQAVSDEPANGPSTATKPPSPGAGKTQPPPVAITFGPQGLVISSQDTEALDRLEELLATVMPRRPDFKVFYLKHTNALDMAWLLDDVFKEEEKSSSRNDYMSWYWGYPSSGSSDKGRSRLSKRKPLKFIPDSITNTLLVQGADATRLAEIEWLIKFYDQVPPDSQSVRVTQMIPIRYATAKEIAEVVKEVYRDLLSPNDRALAAANARKQSGSLFTYNFARGDSANGQESLGLPKFKGQLSVGVDERANILIVSATKILATQISALVEVLDKAAMPSRPVTRVLPLGSTLNIGQLQQALSKVGRSSKPEPKTEKATREPSEKQRPKAEVPTAAVVE